MSKLYSELENLYEQDILINQEQVSIFEWLIRHREDINNIEIDYLNYFQDAQEKIQELKHRLSNCIEPKFKIGQEVWVVDNLSEKIYVGQILFIEAQKYKEEKESIIWYQVKYFDECTIDDPFEEQFTFATKEEAKAKLEELKK